MASGKAKHPQALDTIAEIESKGERIIEWIGANARIVLGVSAVLLIAAAVYGFTQNSGAKREAAASAAVEKVRSEYMTAMGAAPGALTVPELANPAAGERIRSEYRDRFVAVATEQAGTAGGALAALGGGDLAAESGDAAGALEIWREGIAALPSDSGLRGLLQQRIAQALEASGDWVAAAEAYVAAGEVAAYSFRYWALAEAARCYIAADQPERAQELAQRIAAEAPDLELPDSLRTQLRELETGGAG